MNFLIKSSQLEIEESLAKKMAEADRQKIYHLLQHRWHNLMDWCGNIFTDPLGRSIAMIWGQFAQKWDRATQAGDTSSIPDAALQDQLRQCERARNRAREITTNKRGPDGKLLPCPEEAFGDRSQTYREEGYFLNTKVDPNEVDRLRGKLSSAGNILAKYGFSEEVSKIANLIENLTAPDPASSNLTPEKMLRNLSEKGWMFNDDDGQVVKKTVKKTVEKNNKPVEVETTVEKTEVSSPDDLLVELPPDEMVVEAGFWGDNSLPKPPTINDLTRAGVPPVKKTVPQQQPAHNALKALQPGPNVLDRLGKINFDNWKDPGADTKTWEVDAKGQPANRIDLNKGDLVSFKSLYNFLVKNNLKQPNLGGINSKASGFTFGDWNKITTWFVNKAKRQFDNIKNTTDPNIVQNREQYAGLAREYYQAAFALQQALYKAGNLRPKDKRDPNEIVDWDLLNRIVPS